MLGALVDPSDCVMLTDWGPSTYWYSGVTMSCSSLPLLLVPVLVREAAEAAMSLREMCVRRPFLATRSPPRCADGATVIGCAYIWWLVIMMINKQTNPHHSVLWHEGLNVKSGHV